MRTVQSSALCCLLPASFSPALHCLVLLLLCITPRCQAVQAENVTVLEGGTAQISCRLQKYDGSIVVIQNPRRQTLFFNGTRALKDDRFQMMLFSPTMVRITLTNVSVSDEGGYFCQLYTDSTHHQVATLSVSVPPEIPTVEVKQEAVEGGEAELTCVSPRSKPAATLRWMRNGREIPGVVSQQDNGKTFSVSSTIRIPVERKDNGAALNCEALHPSLGGQNRVRRYRLDVYFAPTVRIIPPSGILREGDSLSLTCSITGNPLPRTTQWSKINDTLPERAEISGPTLQIARLSQSHNGTYLCQAQNNYGRAADYYTLLVYDNVSLTTTVPTTQLITSHPTTSVLPSSSIAPEPRDPGAVVETHSAVPYAVIGGVLALLVFTVICVLIVTIWCSVRQKGSYLTHEASGLDEHGEVQEAFLNGNDVSQGKKEYLL
ncbi:cell adhesion molecule 4 isoform X2 [Nothobranchius furzeri]|uniref:Cell adhesion molecule 4 n=1 Tax=Nothobranchius furzeri TaxID=105023 RepID=A0A8C6KC00_NOTFU|nr:cell adhesion molecule 4 isoform X2 [Nothobranchius furzeri]KAF7226880.1 transcript variant X2 [Nothobranchius furzeri]